MKDYVFFKEHDWEGDYSWHEEGQEEFNQKVIALLEERTANEGVADEK